MGFEISHVIDALLLKVKIDFRYPYPTYHMSTHGLFKQSIPYVSIKYIFIVMNPLLLEQSLEKAVALNFI